MIPSTREHLVDEKDRITPAWNNFFNNIWAQMNSNSSFTIPNYLRHTGSRVGFYNVEPVIRASAITEPVGGSSIDTEARVAINEIITALKNIGITS
jgi:hypothetical protein